MDTQPVPAETELTPPSAEQPPNAPPDAPPAQPELNSIAAGAAVYMGLAVGAMLCITALLGWLLSSGTAALNWARGSAGVLFLLLAALSHWLNRHRRLGSVAVLMIIATGAAATVHTVISGLGIHSLLLPAFAMLIAMAGALVGLRLAMASLVVYLVIVTVLTVAEMQGWIQGRQAVTTLPINATVVGLVMLGVAAIALATPMHRLLRGSLHRARQEQERLLSLLRLGTDWTWEADARGRVSYVSPSVTQHTGIEADEYLRMDQHNVAQVITRESIERMQAALRRRQPFRDLLLELPRPSGMLYLRMSGEPILDARGQMKGWRGLGRNITDEVLSERRAQGVRDMLDHLFRMAPDATCLVRMDNGQVLFANPAFLAFCGRGEGEVIGRIGRELGLWVNEGDDVRLAQALAAGQGVLRDWRCEAMRADGRRRTALVNGATFERNGLPVAVLSVRDVTAAERAKLQADAILDGASVGIALVRDHTFVRVNPALAAIARKDVAELIGQPVWNVLPDRAAYEKLATHHKADMAQGRTVSHEFELPIDADRPAIVRMLGRALDPKRLEEDGQLWLVEDITADRRGERELAQAREQAEAASRAKSAFLATMSHEIRTPLNGVVGLARLLETETQPVRRAQYTKHLLESAQALSGLVSDVLDLSKIEAGRMTLERAPFDLHEIVRASFQALAALGEEKGLAMQYAIDERLPLQRLGDAVRVRQIIANYLGNALKFTARGRVLLSVRPSDSSVAGSDGVRIEVQDTGIGIAPAAQSELFQAFAQADGSTTRRFGGSGLGLSICRELAHLMGGQVGVNSVPGQGSVFWAEIVLPVLPVHEAATAAARPLLPKPLQGLRVLVAEDNEVNRLIAHGMLERLGVDVQLATDGHQAVEMALAAQPGFDAVLMDLHMPVQDGLAAARALRANPLTAHLSLIAWTAAVLDQERQDARAAGMDEFVGKPVSEGELLRVLQPLKSGGSTRTHSG
jgi:PAS domain S-box-containing protein